MPSFGLGEILIILIVIVLFIQPEDLPKFIRNFGRVYRDFQRFFIRMKSMSQETLNELAQLDADDPPKKPSNLGFIDNRESRNLSQRQAIHPSKIPPDSSQELEKEKEQ